MAKKIGSAVIRAVQGVIVAALALVLLANLYTLAAQRLFHNDSPAILGYRSAVVLTGSMEPAIRADDLVIVHRQETYSAGDIIMFRSGANTTTHRVTEVTAEGYRTKGDANNTEVEPISADQIIGQYSGRIPKVGDFALFLQKPLGMVIFIGVPVCAFVVWDILRRRRETRAGDEEKEQLRRELERLKAEKPAE